jgi:hypothetical protein
VPLEFLADRSIGKRVVASLQRDGRVGRIWPAAGDVDGRG